MVFLVLTAPVFLLCATALQAIAFVLSVLAYLTSVGARALHGAAFWSVYCDTALVIGCVLVTVLFWPLLDLGRFAVGHFYFGEFVDSYTGFLEPCAFTDLVSLIPSFPVGPALEVGDLLLYNFPSSFFTWWARLSLAGWCSVHTASTSCHCETVTSEQFIARPL